jgi:hypothetical protein
MFYGTLINLFADVLLKSDMTNSNIDFSKLEDESEKVDACSIPTGNNTV